jgi:histidinol-phosphate/aromatic aminotransferase/cobyric acid decarboxylase-like protein
VRRIFDYYRQFEELTPEEVSAQLLARRDEERARAVTEVPLLDLSSGAWPGPPHPEAVNAATFALRRALNAYPDPRVLVAAVAAGRGVRAEQVAPGHGASGLLRAALGAIAPGGEVAVAWPGWGPLPRLVHEAGGTPVPVPLGPAGAADAAALLDAVGDATRAVALCTPNDPTGAAVPLDDLVTLADRLPERVWLLADAALAEFGEDDLAPLLEHRERVLLVHSSAKAHALAGLRAGYALGPPGPLLDRLTPVGGIASPAQAALAWSVEHGADVLARRRAAATAERDRLAALLDGTSLSFAPGVGPLAWLRSSAVDGRTLASHLAARRITVMPGEAWGDEAHVRVTLRDAAATERLAAALRELP